jgi:DNA-directed RNA polymerase, mitochondrial
MEVGNRAWQVVERDAAKGNPIAIEWVPKMMDPSSRRGLVKRSVMTVPYGVTEFGVADFMIKDKHVDDSMENKWNAAKYMRDIIMSSIDETLANGRRLQRWFQACAVKCAENGLPLQWDTPAGSKITQAYRNVIQRRIQSFQSKFYIYEEPQAGEDQEEFLARIGMDEKKMGTAAPPNVVHSCDASHLQITVCRMADAGIKDFSMIHDSFGCPMAHVGLMRDILRQSAVDMYAGDYLQTWKESVERYSGLTMPEPPELGDFDITEILESEFFFS